MNHDVNCDFCHKNRRGIGGVSGCSTKEQAMRCNDHHEHIAACLPAAEQAAKINFVGWQQEIARSEAKDAQLAAQARLIERKDAALRHCLLEHGGFWLAGESERLVREALSPTPPDDGCVRVPREDLQQIDDLCVGVIRREITSPVVGQIQSLVRRALLGAGGGGR